MYENPILPLSKQRFFLSLHCFRSWEVVGGIDDEEEEIEKEQMLLATSAF